MDLLDNVKDRRTFTEFISALIKNKKDFDNEWENVTIEHYLETATAWLEDSQKTDISWKIMAEFLYSGKIYE